MADSTAAGVFVHVGALGVLPSSQTMEPQHAFPGQDTLLRAGSKQQLQEMSAADDDSSSSWTHSCRRIARRSPSAAPRHAPYPAAGGKDTATDSFSSASGAFAVSQQHQIQAEAVSPAGCAYQATQQQQQQWLVGSLRQQPLESLLDLAIGLASKSLSRTMESFQLACNCWAFPSDSQTAAQALEVAEECMTRTMHRMQIVQQLAAAVLSRTPSQELAQHQAQQQQRLLNVMQALQGQYLGTVPEELEGEGEEVSSSWRPASCC